MCKAKESPLLHIQSQLLRSVDKLALSSPNATPAQQIADRLDFWLSTPVDQLMATVDSKRIRSAQYLIGLLTDIQSEGRKGEDRA